MGNVSSWISDLVVNYQEIEEKENLEGVVLKGTSHKPEVKAAFLSRSIPVYDSSPDKGNYYDIDLDGYFNVFELGALLRSRKI